MAQELTMMATGLVVFIVILTLAIYDLAMVVFKGTGSSVSQFLITTAYKSPLVNTAFSMAFGHLFLFMYPMSWQEPDVTKHWESVALVAVCSCLTYEGIRQIVVRLFRKDVKIPPV